MKNVAFISVLIVLLHPSLWWAQNLEEELTRHTLAGLTEIAVLINVPKDVQEISLDDTRALVESKLRIAGITLINPREMVNRPTTPTLHLSFTSTPSSSPVVAWAMAVHLTQRVLLERNPAIGSAAPTWSAATSFGYGPRADLERLKKIEGFPPAPRRR